MTKRWLGSIGGTWGTAGPFWISEATRKQTNIPVPIFGFGCWKKMVCNWGRTIWVEILIKSVSKKKSPKIRTCRYLDLQYVFFNLFSDFVDLGILKLETWALLFWSFLQDSRSPGPGMHWLGFHLLASGPGKRETNLGAFRPIRSLL